MANVQMIAFPRALLSSAAVRPEGAAPGRSSLGHRSKSEVQTHLRRGLALYSEGVKLAAVYHYRLALRLDPANALGHYLLGLALSALGQAEEARSEWRAALDGRNDEAQDLWARRQAHMLLMRYDAQG